MSNFRLFPGLKLSIEPNIACRNLFLNGCFCWDLTISLREMDHKVIVGGTIGYGGLYLESCFVIAKYLDCMQYYMMLLQRKDHIVGKVHVFVTELDDDQNHVWLVF